MSNSGLGRAIINRIEKKKKATVGNKVPIFVQQSEENVQEKKKLKMKSIIEQTSVNDFIETAKLTKQQFQANRDIKFRQIRQEIKNKKIIVNNHKKNQHQVITEDLLKNMQLPRRPAWNQFHTKEQLDQKEVQSYMQWRRKIANIEEQNDVHVTPYERNIEVWRQLWRVVDRSHVIMQIVDGRDPMFFWSQDLIQYSKQINAQKLSILLINKSDLMSQQQRKKWNKYLKEKQINHIFYTAKVNNLNTNEQFDAKLSLQESINKHQVISSMQLRKLLEKYGQFLKKQKVEIGLVGYPNVGKSSVINSLLGEKKVAVANMPGKTKHFQTLILNERVTLCDCPGLVFPRVTSSVAQMVLNGLYPLDNVKKYEQPIELLITRIERQKICHLYFIPWKNDDIYNCETILNKYAQVKGFFTGNGLPNQSLAARNILKDYVNGILVYVNPPYQQIQNVIIQKEQQTNLMRQKIQKQLDEKFFQQQVEVEREIQNATDKITQDDLLDIIQGKKIQGIKITKQMRKQIKHALKRGQKTNDIVNKYIKSKKQQNKVLIKI